MGHVKLEVHGFEVLREIKGHGMNSLEGRAIRFVKAIPQFAVKGIVLVAVSLD